MQKYTIKILLLLQIMIIAETIKYSKFVYKNRLCYILSKSKCRLIKIYGIRLFNIGK